MDTKIARDGDVIGGVYETRKRPISDPYLLVDILDEEYTMSFRLAKRPRDADSRTQGGEEQTFLTTTICMRSA